MPLACMDSKRDFRCLQRISALVAVIPWMFYRDNVLRNPPGVDVKSWLNTVVRIIGSLDLRIASPNLLLDIVLKLFEKHSFSGEPYQQCPNLGHLLEEIRALKCHAFSNIARYKESLDNRISGVMNHLGDVVRCNHGIDLSKLLRTHFVLELDGLTQEMKVFLITVLAARIFMYRIAHGDRTQQLKTLIIMDEGQQIFRRSYELSDSPFFMAEMIAQAREFGCGIAVGAQSVRDLAFSLMANTSHKILVGGFADQRDLEELCRII